LDNLSTNWSNIYSRL